MGAFGTLVRRELGSYFMSLTGYVIIASVLLLLGVSFADILEAYNGSTEGLDAPMTEIFYSTPFFWMIILLTTPLITMRLFAHERFSGTFETLMTAPVGDLQVVLAKFTGALTFYLLTWVPLLACIGVVHRYTGQGTRIDWWPMASTFLGIGLLGCLYLAMGTFASSLTRSQMIAAMISLALSVSLFLLSFLKLGLDAQWAGAEQVLGYVRIVEHMEDFARGVVDTRHLTFYLTSTAFFLFLTLKTVESRRWK